MQAKRIAIAFVGCLAISVCPDAFGAAAEYRVAEDVVVGKVPSWLSVQYCLLTHGQRQYVAYYDETHQMTVASRDLGEDSWNHVKLDSKVGWDNHNGIWMAIDRKGSLHLSGNMHCDPLVYFRSDPSGRIETLRRQTMTGRDEESVTYPRFLKYEDGRFLFMYRSGGSGNGRRFINCYDETTETWNRLIDTPLFDGEGERNAYPHGPSTKRQDGFYHMEWVWRDTPDCATSHHLCYARSKDLIHWESAGGVPVQLPITFGQKELWVDPVPTRGGIINGCDHLSFDAHNRPIISYHKQDEQGNMQIYFARFEDGEWVRRAITKWDKKVVFGGTGGMPFFGISISGLQESPSAGDLFFIDYRHRDYGTGRIVVDKESLLPVDRAVPIVPELPLSLSETELDFEGILIRRTEDSGEANEPGVRYLLQREVLPKNHDRPRKPPFPPPSPLRVIKLVKTDQAHH